METMVNQPAKQSRLRRKADVLQASAAPAQPSREAIAHRAYELYLQRGGEHGADVDDWLAAERELRAAAGDGALRAPVNLKTAS